MYRTKDDEILGLSFDDEETCKMTYAIIDSLTLLGVKDTKDDKENSSVTKKDENVPKWEQSQVEIERTHIFTNEFKELLQHAPDCRLSIDEFIPTYRKYFGRQCMVADYGFTKLSELFEAISSTVEITKNADGERLLQLNQTLQEEQNIKIMAEEKPPTTELAETFMKISVPDGNEAETATSSSTDDDTLQSLQERRQLKINESPVPSVIRSGPRAALTMPQLSQAIQHLFKTDPFFVEKLHEAYADSLNNNVS
jgi:hypothetical protein